MISVSRRVSGVGACTSTADEGRSPGQRLSSSSVRTRERCSSASVAPVAQRGRRCSSGVDGVGDQSDRLELVARPDEASRIVVAQSDGVRPHRTGDRTIDPLGTAYEPPQDVTASTRTDTVVQHAHLEHDEAVVGEDVARLDGERIRTADLAVRRRDEGRHTSVRPEQHRIGGPDAGSPAEELRGSCGVTGDHGRLGDQQCGERFERPGEAPLAPFGELHREPAPISDQALIEREPAVPHESVEDRCVESLPSHLVEQLEVGSRWRADRRAWMLRQPELRVGRPARQLLAGPLRLRTRRTAPSS